MINKFTMLALLVSLFAIEGCVGRLDHLGRRALREHVQTMLSIRSRIWPTHTAYMSSMTRSRIIAHDRA